MSRPKFFFSDALMQYDMGPNHPLKPRRLFMTEALLKSYGLFESTLERLEPEPADWEEVARTHSRDYLDVLSALDRGGNRPDDVRVARKYGFGTGDNPIFPHIYASSLLYTGGSVAAAQAVNEGDPIAFNIAGGLHHAHYARAAGFCVLNDCAVGIRRLRDKFARVAYVDIDVHHGDGVQESFYDDPTVLTVSLHETGQTLFPGTGDTTEIGAGAGEGYSVNLPFAPYTTDDVWLSAWRESALPLLKAFDPEAIFLQMGTDTHAFDPLAHLCLSAQGWLEAIKDVKALGKPIVAVGGGGYNLTTVPRMWTLAVSTLAGAELSDAVPASYAFRNQIPALLDYALPGVDPAHTEYAHAFAARSVAELQQSLFPRFGL